MVLLEYDPRFRSFGSQFCQYDYNSPVKLPPRYKQAFTTVYVDPPFRSEECIEKSVQTAKFLAKPDDQVLPPIILLLILPSYNSSNLTLMLTSNPKKNRRHQQTLSGANRRHVLHRTALRVRDAAPVKRAHERLSASTHLKTGQPLPPLPDNGSRGLDMTVAANCVGYILRYYEVSAKSHSFIPLLLPHFSCSTFSFESMPTMALIRIEHPSTTH